MPVSAKAQRALEIALANKGLGQEIADAIDNLGSFSSSAVNAATAITNLIVGTPVTAAIPAGSAVYSNITADGDQVFMGQTGGNSQEWLRYDASAKAIIVNEASGDVDFRLESNVLSNFLVIDANSCLNGQIAFGGAVPTNPQAFFSILPAVNATGVTADQSYFHATLLPGAAVTIPTGTAGVVASLNLHEPNITATGTVTVACTLRIVDAPTEGSSNYALWVDAGVTRLDGNLEFSTALDVVVPANTALALELTNGSSTVAAIDTRNTLKDVATLTLTAIAPTITSETAAHINATLRTANKTITYTGTTGTTSSLGTQAYFGVTTITDASVMTLTTASAVHINAIAAAGGSLTISNSYMVSTSVSGCFLTNAGVWTDMACWAAGKKAIATAKDALIDGLLAQLLPKTWTYDEAVHGNDHGRQRVGIVYDDLPDELRSPGQEAAVSAGLLSSFALAALKVLWERNQALEARLARAGL